MALFVLSQAEFERELMNCLLFLVGIAFSISLEAQTEIRFANACAPEESLEIVAVGDVLLHAPLQIQATQSSDRFAGLWHQVTPFLQEGDVTYANLEGPAAPGVSDSGANVPDPGFHYDDFVYSSYPQFNYHPFVIDDLQRSGVDVVSTANNHALDRFSLGIDRTMDQLLAKKMHFTGTRSSRDLTRPWWTVTHVRGRSLAWLACTFSTNGIKDRLHQVLPCYENTKDLLDLVHQLSQDPEIDAVIVTPHWGVEYEFQPHASQTWLGHQLIEAGATAVIGTHPHVLQPWEKYISKDGREGFIMYSTGNFVSGQDPLVRRTSLLLKLSLVSHGNKRLSIRGVRFLPLLMNPESGHREVLPVLRYDNSIPEVSMKIWKQFYSEKQRILSLNENSASEICKASQ
jgi:poly-gamma-glutamate synthesis protein (capsule biosynthesis protein)